MAKKKVELKVKNSLNSKAKIIKTTKTIKKKSEKTGQKQEAPAKLDMRKIQEEIQKAMTDHDQIQDQRKPVVEKIEKANHKTGVPSQDYIKTGIPGFDELFTNGIPRGTSVLVCGGPGSGKTIFCLQTLAYGAAHGEKCLYMTFEESEERLKSHMRDFGWEPDKLIKKGNLVIKRYDPFEVTRQVEAMLEKAKGELLIDVKPMLFPKGFKPDRVAVDSLSAIASAFVGKQDTYRIYIEQLFRLLEEMKSTSFLIAESTDVPVKLTQSGVEEFLADGVIIMYNIQKENIRENAVEILKIRGEKFKKKVVALEIQGGKGIVVYPEQEVFEAV